MMETSSSFIPDTNQDEYRAGDQFSCTHRMQSVVVSADSYTQSFNITTAAVTNSESLSHRWSFGTDTQVSTNNVTQFAQLDVL